jgi:hypothetical protein
MDIAWAAWSPLRAGAALAAGPPSVPFITLAPAPFRVDDASPASRAAFAAGPAGPSDTAGGLPRGLTLS